VNFTGQAGNKSKAQGGGYRAYELKAQSILINRRFTLLNPPKEVCETEFNRASAGIHRQQVNADAFTCNELFAERPAVAQALARQALFSK
jgi:hypothetical protein